MPADGTFDALGDAAGDIAAAPYFAALAEGPSDGHAVWLTASDGVRVRAVVWGKGAPKGTILLFPGRTEYAEKYGRAAAEMQQRGYATVSIDWRGQGIADRSLGNRAIGHVGDFAEYQRDVAALMAFVRAENMPEPLYLLAHSMGGCIGLRSLLAGLPVAAVGFTGPMWGVQMVPRMRPVAWTLSTLSRPLGLTGRRTPGQIDETYVLRSPFEGNALTTDAETWDWMQDHLRTQPDLALGGASLGWLNAALREMWALSRMPSPDVPCLTALGTLETIVDVGRIRARMAAWPRGDLWVIDGAGHEIMMEKAAVRSDLYDRLDTLFTSARR